MTLKEVLENRRDLLEIHISLQQRDINVDLFKELTFEVEELQDHIQSQAGMLAWWSTAARIAEFEYEELKRKYDMWYTPRYEKAFETLSKQKDIKKPNISSVENLVKQTYTEEYKEWKNRLAQARLNRSILKDAVDWWEEKGQMLIQSAKRQMAEIDSIDLGLKEEGKTTSPPFPKNKKSRKRQKVKDLLK